MDSRNQPDRTNQLDLNNQIDCKADHHKNHHKDLIQSPFNHLSSFCRATSNRPIHLIICTLLVLTFTSQVNARSYFDNHLNYNGRCEEIQISFCRDLPYNQTILPNVFNHQSQDIARSHLRVYEPLIKLKCSPYLQLFLCTLYAPICLNNKEPVPPCRNLCLSAKNGCEEHIPSDWEKKFNCSNFPLFDNQPLCIWKPDDYASISLINRERSLEDAATKETFQYYNSSSRQFRFSCPIQFRTPSQRGHVFNLNGKKYADCATPCDLYLSRDQTQIVRYWSGFWSVVCLLSSLFTFLTFFIDSFIDPKRFHYPEKQIIFIALCYIFIGFIYFVGFLTKDQIACTPLLSSLVGDTNLEFIKSVTQGSNDNAYCTLMAMALYYFTMASAIWFVLLAMSWYIHTGPKWGYEGIEKNAHYYHLIAWTVPAIKTIVLVSKNQIEGDQLTGVCYVGLLDRNNLIGYLFWPLCIYLSVGITFLVMAIVELWKIRQMLVKNPNTQRQRIVMFKIVLFGAFYVIPNLILIACYLIEYYRIDQWSLSWLSRSCSNKQYGIPCPNLAPDEEELYRPSVGLFLIKYLALLATGITSGIWIWSKKTIDSWETELRALNDRLMNKFFCNEKGDEAGGI